MQLRRWITTLLLALLVSGTTAHAATPTAVRIGTVDCVAGGVPVELRNPAAAPTRFTLLRDDVVVDSVVLATSAPVRRVIPLAEGASARITVRYGSSYTSSQLQRRCERDTRTASAAIVPAGRTAGLRDALVTKADAQPDRPAGTSLDDGLPRWPLALLAVVGLVSLPLAGTAIVRGRGRSTTTSIDEAAQRALDAS